MENQNTDLTEDGAADLCSFSRALFLPGARLLLPQMLLLIIQLIYIRLLQVIIAIK